MYISHQGLKAVHDQQVKEYLDRAVMKRMIREAKERAALDAPRAAGRSTSLRGLTTMLRRALFQV